MTHNQLLALRSGCKVRVIRPGGMLYGAIGSFSERSKINLDGEAKLYALIKVEPLVGHLCYLAPDIEPWSELNDNQPTISLEAGV